MSEQVTQLRERLETRCRIELYSGYGLLLAGMGVLYWAPAARTVGWGLLILGIAARVMHYLDHLSLRTLRKLEQSQAERELRHSSPAKGKSPGAGKGPGATAPM
jgi:hypothetical protein